MAFTRISTLSKSLHKLLFISIFVASSVLVLSQEKISYNLDELDAYFEKARQDWDIPGMAIAIVKDNKVILSKGYGVKDLRTQEPVDENTIFGIASNSKAFTAATIMLLVEEGKLNLDDKVIDHLPYFQAYDPYVTSELTVRDLLCHRSGYKTFSGDLLWYGSNYSREEVLKRVKYLKPAYSFRSRYGYSNVMFLAAGEVVTNVSGITWDVYLKQKVFEPLGMNSTNTSINDNTNDNVATPHFTSINETFPIKPVNWDNMSPAGGINSSVNDMSKWIIAQLNHGKYNDIEIFSETSSKTMWTPHTISRTGSLDSTMHFDTYGLGWDLFDYHGRLVVNHSGGLDGMISHVALVPEENLGMVVLTNSNNYLPSALMYVIINHFLDVDYRDLSALYLEYRKRNQQRKEKIKIKEEEDRDKKSKPSLSLEKYTGIFGGDLYGNAEIKLNNKQLEIDFIPTPIFKAKLSHWHYDTFELEFMDYPSLPKGKVQFILNAKGEVVEFTVDVPNPDFDFTELEFKRLD